MKNKLALLFIFLILALSIFSFASTTIEPNKSITYYLKALNANLVQKSQTAQIIQPNSTTATSIITKEQYLTAECIEKIFIQYDSPAKNLNLGEKIISEAKTHSIDAGYALATFRIESSFGKNGYAAKNKSIGNRKDAQGNFIKYDSWEESVTDWFDYIEKKYTSQGITTIETIAPIYAPPTENNTAKYITDITSFMEQHKDMC
jgi:hypothetical protein